MFEHFTTTPPSTTVLPFFHKEGEYSAPWIFPVFYRPAEKKGWIVSKANKTGQFSIIATTPDVRAFHNYPTVYDGPPLVSLGLVALCGTPDDFALQNLLVVIKKGNYSAPLGRGTRRVEGVNKRPPRLSATPPQEGN